MLFRDRILPALVLAGITPVLTELISGNIPANVFFLPWALAFLLVVYGLPVLLLREIFIRWELGLPGLFVLGLAYGIYNEGVCAKTLLRDVDVPINAFDHYAWHGINFPWAALIVPWHALHAIIFPIALVTWWFPASARSSWLSTGVASLMALFVVGFGSMVYLGNKQHVTPPIYLLIFLAAIFALILLSRQTSRRGPFLEASGRAPLWAAAAGFTFYPVFVLGASICAGMKLSGIIVCLVAALVLAGYYRLLVTRGALVLRPFLLFALSDYFSCALITGAQRLARGFLIGVVTELVLLGIIGFLISKINDPVFYSRDTKSGLK